jgi:hypothetical protein
VDAGTGIATSRMSRGNRSSNGINASPAFANALLAGWVSGAAGVLATHPLDTIRTRLQNVRPCAPISNFQVINHVHSNLGMSGFFRGALPPVLLRGVTFSVQRSAIGIANQLIDRAFPQQDSFVQRHHGLIMGATGGLVSAFVDTPIILLKAMAQTHDRTKHRETIGQYLREARRVMRESGPKGFWSGFVPSACLAVPSWSMMYLVYDALRGDGISKASGGAFMELSPPVAGALSAMLSWPLFYPFDVLRTRMQLAKGERPFMHFARVHFSQPFAMWFPGMSMTLLRAAPRYAITFTILEWMQNHPVF